MNKNFRITVGIGLLITIAFIMTLALTPVSAINEANAISNGSFESFNSSYVPYFWTTYNAYSSETFAYVGSYSLNLLGSSSYATQSVGVSTSAAIEIIFYFYGTSSTPYVQINGNSKSTDGYCSSGSSGAWTKCTFTNFDSSLGSLINSITIYPGSSYTYVDDVQFWYCTNC